MKVIIANATGSQVEEALIDKDSGVIEFKSGDISHVLYEKQLGKTIKVYVEPRKEEIKEEVKEASAASPEQSKEGKKKKTK